jgi:putative addiction module antidote
MIAGEAGDAPPQNVAMKSYLPASQPQSADADRKLVRNSSMELVTKDPADTAEKIRQVAERLGGFLLKSVTNGQDAQGAFLEVCVPANRFEEARAEIRKLGVRVDSERVEAQDVTRQYVDLDARLRNLRGEEAQYLSIMKGAHTVKDALEVSEKLSNVRGQIEQQQAIAMKLKLRAVGTSTGILLPKEMLVRMKLKKDDNLFAVETPEGYLLTPYDPEVERQLGKGREFMSKYRETFRALAK